MTTREIIYSMSALLASVAFLNLGIGAINSFVALRMDAEGFADIYVGFPARPTMLAWFPALCCVAG